VKSLTEEQKVAARLRSKLWAKNNRDKVRERARRRAAQPEVKAYQKKYRASRISESREYNRQWRAANPEKVKKYSADYRARDPERANGHSRRWQRRAMGLPEPTRPQPECCEACGRPCKSMHLDHCHLTGKFRGWLCGRCNRGLGCFDDCIEGLHLALDYLKRVEVASRH
jgi:hypothetical protein